MRNCAVVSLWWLLLHFINGICGFYIQPIITRFISHPQSQVAVQNSTVVFHCSINKTQLDESLPDLAIVWFHNGNLTNDSPCSRTLNYDSDSTIVSSCVIESVQITDQGWYQCHIIDGVNETLCKNLPCIKTETTSRSAHLKLIGEDAVQNSSFSLSSNLTGVILHCLMLEGVSDDILSDFEVVWKKDSQFIHNSETFQILHSNNLLVISNSSTIQEVVGKYECLVQVSNNSHVVNRIDILEKPAGVSSSISLSLTLSSSYDESTTNFLVSSHSPVELVCLFTGLASPFITWTHNNENLGDSYHEVWLKMNQWLPGNYCCSVNEVVTSSCISIHVINPEPLYMSTMFIEENITSLQLNCNSSLPVQWVHNGAPIALDDDTPATTLSLSNRSVHEMYGVYQCNRLNETIVLYRVLPFGWTNPVTYFQPLASLPVFNLSLLLEPPTFTGGLDRMSLLVKILTVIKIGPFDTLQHVQTLHKHFQTSSFTEGGSYVFNITVVNSSGSSISESTITSLFTPCSIYAPVPPAVTFTCGKQASLLEWTRSSLDPYPLITSKHVVVRCFNSSSHEVYFHPKVWSPDLKNGSLSITANIGANGTCNYTLEVSRSLEVLCASDISGTCSVTTTSTSALIIPTSHTTQSTSALIIPTSHTSQSITTVTTGEVDYYSSSIVVTHVVGTEISTALSSTAPSSTAPSSTTPSLTLSLLPNERLSSEVTITVIAISSVLIGIILALTFFCFVSVVVWKQRRRMKNRYVVTSANSTEQFDGFNPPSPSFLFDEDTISITTCYDNLDSSTFHVITDQQQVNKDVQEEHKTATATCVVLQGKAIYHAAMEVDDGDSVCNSVATHSSNDSAFRSSESSWDTYMISGYLMISKHLSFMMEDDSNNTPLLHGSQQDNLDQCSPTLSKKFLLPISMPNDVETDSLHTYENMESTVH